MNYIWLILVSHKLVSFHMKQRSREKQVKILFLFLAVYIYSNISLAIECSQNAGVLILAHGSHAGHHHLAGGGHSKWEHYVSMVVSSAKKRISSPVELAFGMWDQQSFQAGINKLAQKNICELRIIPFFLNSHSEMIEIQKYMFGINQTNNSPIEVNKVEIPESIKIVKFGKALDDHIFLSEILYDRIVEIAKQPAKQGLILVAHGPCSFSYWWY